MAKTNETMMARLYMALATLEQASGRVEYYLDEVRKGFSLRVVKAPAAVRARVRNYADGEKRYQWRGRRHQTRLMFLAA